MLNSECFHKGANLLLVFWNLPKVQLKRSRHLKPLKYAWLYASRKILKDGNRSPIILVIFSEQHAEGRALS